MKKQISVWMVATVLLSSNAIASSSATCGLWKANDNATWRAADGNCWHNARWTPSQSFDQCGNSLEKAETAAPAPTPAPVAAPAPAPVAAKPAVEIKMSAVALFDFDKSTLKNEGMAELSQLAEKLKNATVDLVVAVGHTDSTGAEAYNQKLSDQRAQTAKDYLVSLGMPADRIFTEAKGEMAPVASNATSEGRAQNRRVEVDAQAKQ